MENRKAEKRANWIIPIITTVIITIVISAHYDFYYDLNDDVLMKDILSGAYTGEPESHNIQMLWLLGAALSGLYRLYADIPWYGLFLCLCQLGAMGIVLNRTLLVLDYLLINNKSYNNNRYKRFTIKLIASVTLTVLLLALMLRHLIFVQYTITVAFLSSAAVLWFVTSEMSASRVFGQTDHPDRESGDTKTILKANLPTLLLVFLAFLLRSEMLLLMLPFFCVAGVAKWGREPEIFGKRTVRKYLSFLVVVAFLLLLGYGTNKIAYGSPEWRTFTRLFDARTELYDFQQIPPYEGNEAFYESIGLAREEQVLLENYNYGVSERINADLMERIAAYAAEKKREAEPFGKRLSGALRRYGYRLTHIRGAGTDFPYSALALLCYLAALAAGFAGSRHAGVRTAFETVLLFLIRSAVWLYIMLGGREPERITHSLYFIEVCVLLGLLLLTLYNTFCAGGFVDETMEQDNGKNALRVKRVFLGILPVLLVLMLCISGYAIRSNWRASKTEYERREAVNVPYNELLTTAEVRGKKEGQFYLMDVYSSVAYSEKLFRAQDGGKYHSVYKPVELLGGWACFSPLQTKKLAKDGYDSLAEALVADSGRVSYLYETARRDEALSWIAPYYRVCRNAKIEEISTEEFASGVFAKSVFANREE